MRSWLGGWETGREGREGGRVKGGGGKERKVASVVNKLKQVSIGDVWHLKCYP